MEMTLRHVLPNATTKTIADLRAVNKSIIPESHQDFCAVFCARHQCEPREFIARAFRLALYPRALPLHKLIQRLNKKYFQSDLNFLSEVAKVKNKGDLIVAIKNYQVDCDRSPNYFHDHLNIRVSCGRVMRLCCEVLNLTSDDVEAVLRH